MTVFQHAVTDNEQAGQYEVETPAGTAVLAYVRHDDRINLVHTEVPDAAEGQGVGSALVRFALDAARAAGLRVVPTCPFVAGYVARHPEYRPLLAD